MSFAFSLTEEVVYSGWFDTIEEALEEAEGCFLCENGTLETGSTVYIGENEPVEIPNITSEYIISDIRESLYSEYGDGLIDDYLYNVKSEDLDRLQELLDEAFKKWLIETNNEPKFYTVNNIKQYIYNGKDWECVR